MEVVTRDRSSSLISSTLEEIGDFLRAGKDCVHSFPDVDGMFTFQAASENEYRRAAHDRDEAERNRGAWDRSARNP